MTVQVPVADLYVQCSLKVSNLGDRITTMSDCCRASALYAVIKPGRPVGSPPAYYWRCGRHHDIVSLKPLTFGSYVTSVPRDKHPAE